MPELVPVYCPYCGEAIELSVDASAVPSSWIEDCTVCCRPIEVAVDIDADRVVVGVKTGDE